MKTATNVFWSLLFLSYIGSSQDLPKALPPRWAVHTDLLSHIRGNSSINIGASRFNGNKQDEISLDLYYSCSLPFDDLRYKIAPLRSFQMTWGRSIYRDLDFNKRRNKYYGVELSAMTVRYDHEDYYYFEKGGWKPSYEEYSGASRPEVIVNHLRFRVMMIKGSTYRLSDHWFVNVSGGIGAAVNFNKSDNIFQGYYSSSSSLFGEPLDLSRLEKIISFITHHSYVDSDSGINVGIVFQLRLKVGYYIF